jgi:filamentous hemagglutinin
MPFQMRRVFALLLAAASLAFAQTGTFGRPQIDRVPNPVPVISNVAIVNYDRVIYRGSVDLNPELNRIREGRQLNHRNDGGIFSNRERRLPTADRDTYREFVYTQRGIPFPGPARIILNRQGQVWFTGDHYNSFIKVTK